VKLHVEEKVEEAAVETPELEVIREKKETEPAAAAGPKTGAPEKAKEEPKAKETAKPEKK
jgi:hypothetical protein